MELLYILILFYLLGVFFTENILIENNFGIDQTLKLRWLSWSFIFLVIIVKLIQAFKSK